MDDKSREAFEHIFTKHFSSKSVYRKACEEIWQAALSYAGDESIRKDEAQTKPDALADGLSPSPAPDIPGALTATPLKDL